MVTFVIPIHSLTDAFLFPPFGRAVRIIYENEKWINANESKVADSFFIQKVLYCQAKKERKDFWDFLSNVYKELQDVF